MLNKLFEEENLLLRARIGFLPKYKARHECNIAPLDHVIALINYK